MTALFLLASVLSADDFDPATLIPDGKLAYASHRFMTGEFLEGREAKWTGTAPTRRLREIVLTAEPVIVNGPTTIPLPPGSERVAHVFRYVELKGENLDQLGAVQLAPVRADTNMNRSTQTPTVYRLQLPSLNLPDALTPSFALKLDGQATITSISFKPFGGGLPEQFDPAPFLNLGHDQPVLRVNLSIDPTRALSIEGHSTFDRSKWFRYYGAPNQSPRAIEQYAADRGFVPGRQMFKFEPALVKGYGKSKLLLTEDPTRPGYGDPAFFEQYKNRYYADVLPAFRDVPFAMCFNDYPEFMSVAHTGRGTPQLDKFDAAGELAARFIENQKQHSGRTASYWECKNESSIKAEWDHHFKKDVDSWGELAKFHNTVADAVHARTPDIKIGGPASAWMQVQVQKFQVFRNMARFQDLTRDHVDFYSHHFYEDAASLALTRKEQGEYTNYLNGRVEAICDMFVAHMHGTDNVKPMLITEFGALNVGRSQADYWLRLRSYSAYLVRFMQRPEQFDMVVPFIFLESSWDPYNAHASFVPATSGHKRNEFGTWQPTACAWFFDLWKDFDGVRLVADSPRRLVETVALRDGDRVHLAISNLTGRRLNVRVRDLGPIAKTLQRRITYLDGVVKYEEVDLNQQTVIPVEGEETTTVTWTLKSAKPLAKSVERTHFYAAETAVPVEEQPAGGFELAGPSRRPASAAIVVGVERQGGLEKPLTGQFNGHKFTADADWAKSVNNLFNRIIIPVNARHVRDSNRVEITPQPGLTITSVHLTTDQ